MPLLWNEIRQRAIIFAKNWSSASRERAEAQTFWNEFFDVFGIRRRTVANFEEPVKNLKGDCEFIDLFWPGKLIAEHKSRGRDLSKAATQANGYCLNLLNSNRREEMPRFIIVSDFARFALHDLEAEKPEDRTIEFDLAQLPKMIRHFAFIAGYETRRLDPEDPANMKAVELLGNLHDRLEDVGYVGHDLQRFMVRILFCLFADDSGIFEPDTFKLFVQNRTREDGSDLGPQLARLFGILNTPPQRRQSNLDEDLTILPYVNGELYQENLTFPEFDTAMRTALMSCCCFRWERISPAIFGSLFQAVMLPRERRQIGGHYTSERNILKLIRSLFLDALRAEFESITGNPRKLEEFHRKIGRLKLLDPACGCGNFLIISYRELRRLELDVLQARFGKELSEGDIRAECRVNVSQMYGIEIEEWPVRIAEVALWLMDHQMNQELFERFSQVKATVPLAKSPTIRQANALRLDWNEVLPAGECSYVLGNPPFVGAKFQTDQQRGDMASVTGGAQNAGLLDLVTAWYFKATDYMAQNRAVRAAFVSTNSITQGEQVGVLWPALFARGVKIHFGHRTFAWASEARGKAHVHVVMIGFGLADVPRKTIYDYDADELEPVISVAQNISPYLIEGSDIVITSRARPLGQAPPICFGNQPIDGGHLLLNPQDRMVLLDQQPEARKWIRRYVGADEFINGIERYCLWLKDTPPRELREMPVVMQRLKAVREFRLASKRPATRDLAACPSSFAFVSHPEHAYLLIPSVSSEKRQYSPMAFMPANVIASNLCLLVPDAKLFHFGVLSSAMHMAWVRQVCGRMKSDYRYSNKLVYNNFPWPTDIAEARRARVQELAQSVLDIRVELGDGRVGFLPSTKPSVASCSLGDLYDPISMPTKLLKAHKDLDRAVDACYRSAPFTSERQRVEYLFTLYEQLIAPLTAGTKKARKRGIRGGRS